MDDVQKSNANPHMTIYMLLQHELRLLFLPKNFVIMAFGYSLVLHFHFKEFSTFTNAGCTPFFGIQCPTGKFTLP